MDTDTVRQRRMSSSSELEEPLKTMTWVEFVSDMERKYVLRPLQLFTSSALRIFMKSLGEACTGEGLVVLFALLNWCFDHRLGTHGIWLVPIAEILNGLLKWTFRRPRPAWTDKSVIQMGTSHEYSFPSSHSMISFSLAAYFAFETTSYIPYMIATLVAASRCYEGMHYFTDVTVGAGLGNALGLSLLFVLEMMRETKYTETVDATNRVLHGWVFTGVSLLTLGAFYRSVKDISIPSVWSENVKKTLKKEVKLDPHYIPLLSYIGMSGVLFGLSFGVNLYTPFAMPETFLQGALRFVLGLVILLSAFFGVRALEKVVEPKSIAIALVLRFIRFAQVPPIILMVAPPVFKQLNI